MVARINDCINTSGAEIATAGWLPGSDWTDTKVEPIYTVAARQDYQRSARFFGQLVWYGVMQRQGSQLDRVMNTYCAAAVEITTGTAGPRCPDRGQRFLAVVSGRSPVIADSADAPQDERYLGLRDAAVNAVRAAVAMPQPEDVHLLNDARGEQWPALVTAHQEAAHDGEGEQLAMMNRLADVGGNREMAARHITEQHARLPYREYAEVPEIWRTWQVVQRWPPIHWAPKRW